MCPARTQRRNASCTSCALLLAVIAVSGGCTTNDISQLNAGVNTVAFVQHGDRPLDFSTGVIDPASFWATYGDAVSKQLGGVEYFAALAEDGRTRQQEYAEENYYLVDLLYDRHDLADTVGKRLMPDLAAAWGFAYQPSQLVEVGENEAFIDPRTMSLKGIRIDADLVLMIDVAEINLTERFSAGSVVANGVTFGVNGKSLTVESPTNLRVFRRNSGSGALEFVWGRRCGADYTSMKTSFTLDELLHEPHKMDAVLDEARDQTIERCKALLSRVD